MNKVTLEKALEINCEQEEQRIIKFILKSLKELKRDGAVIGLSGGLDSSTCAYLLKKTIRSNKILALILPERDSATINMAHARLVAKNLGLKTLEIDLSPILQKIGVYDIGPGEIKGEVDRQKYEKKVEYALKLFGRYIFSERLAIQYGRETSRTFRLLGRLLKKEWGKNTAFAYTKVRLRMLYLYHYAWRNNYAVIGTTDKSEYTIGFYDPHGDGASDITILRHLYKTQIRQLAKFVGVPNEIIQKPHSGDLYGNTPNERGLGFTYEQLDKILYAVEKGCSGKELIDIAPEKAIESIKKCMEISKLMRALSLSLD